MKILRLRVTDFAAIREADIDLGRGLNVLYGPNDLGKSTLAVHVAHRVRDAFPDGQLFVDLAGTSECPREAADVLAELLRGLGVIDSATRAHKRRRRGRL